MSVRAAEAERTVLPLIHDAQGRADGLIRSAMSQAHRWEVCLARYDDAWRRRVTGLRDGDAASVADGDARAAAAIRDISEMLARTSSEHTR